MAQWLSGFPKAHQLEAGIKIGQSGSGFRCDPCKGVHDKAHSSKAFLSTELCFPGTSE